MTGVESKMILHDLESPPMLLIICLVLFQGIYAIRNTLEILDSYSLSQIQHTKSNDYLYGIDFTSRRYSEGIGDRFESLPVRQKTYRASRIESIRLFFKSDGFGSGMDPAPMNGDFQVFEVNHRHWYRSTCFAYKDFDSMEYVCAEKEPQIPNRTLLANFLRVAPDLDELQRAQDAMVNEKYPRIKYERADERGSNTRIYPIKVLGDYRPSKLPPPYSTWPYRTVIKSFVMIVAEHHASHTNGEGLSIRRLLHIMHGTFFKKSVYTPSFGGNILVVRILKHPIDTYEDNEVVFIGAVGGGGGKQTIPYAGPKPLGKFSFAPPPSITGKRTIIFHSFREGECCDHGRHYAVMIGIPNQAYTGNMRGCTMDMAYTFRERINESLLVMDQVSRFPFGFDPEDDPDDTD